MLKSMIYVNVDVNVYLKLSLCVQLAEQTYQTNAHTDDGLTYLALAESTLGLDERYNFETSEINLKIFDVVFGYWLHRTPGAATRLTSYSDKQSIAYFQRVAQTE
jgi:hypothetical protein